MEETEGKEGQELGAPVEKHCSGPGLCSCVRSNPDALAEDNLFTVFSSLYYYSTTTPLDYLSAVFLLLTNTLTINAQDGRPIPLIRRN